jgi:N-acetylneuraminic acid mutarotase
LTLINLRMWLFIVLSPFFLYLLLHSNPYLQIAFSEVSEKPHWYTGRNMPTPRTEVTGSLIGQNIYVIGGFDSKGTPLNVVEVYNVLNDSWKKVSPLPQALHHSAATSHGGKLYLVGGFTSDIYDWIPTNKLFIYDPVEDAWKEGRPMPTARGALTAVFVDGILYATGGQQSSDIIVSEIMDTNEAYDPINDVWTSKKSMPTARHHIASAEVGGKIYVIGGRTAANSSLINLNVNEMYDPLKDTWTSLTPMPSKRSGIAASTVNNTIYALGGEDAGGVNPKTYDNNEKYNPSTGLWLSEEPIPTSRHGLAAVSIDDQIFVIGGGPEAGLSVTDANEIFKIK